jgi:hypothetical protein
MSALLDMRLFEVWIPTEGHNRGIALPAFKDAGGEIMILGADGGDKPTHFRERSIGPKDT